MKRWRILCRGLLCFCMMFVMLFSVSAAGAGRKAALLLKYEHDGAKFWIYQVTDAESRKTGAFKDCDIPMDTETNAGLQRTAAALAGFAEERQAEPQGVGEISENRLSFTGLDAGWYLVCGKALKEGKYTYTPAPFLVLLSEGKKQVSDVKADQAEGPVDPTDPSNPTDPSDPTDPSSPTDPSRPTGSGDHNDDDDDNNSPDRPAKPVHTDQGGPGGEASSLSSFSEPENVEFITLEQPEMPNESGPAAIPKLGDMGAAVYLLGMVISLGLCAVLLVLRKRLKCGREQ